MGQLVKYLLQAQRLRSDPQTHIRDPGMVVRACYSSNSKNNMRGRGKHSHGS